ncbi:MAG: site-specific integrase [Treponema sp.]|nr:site-specific integrase [Treponema sp.]
MRYKEPFTVYPRKLKTVTVFYYQCYDSNGKRICGHSTGQRTKTAAKIYCMELYKKGKLVPEKRTIGFADFAVGWWNPKTCKYLEWRRMQNPLAPSTIDHYKTSLERHIKPYFGNMRLNTICQETIQNWIITLSRKGCSNSSINVHIATLKVMLKEAVRLKLITFDPSEKIKKLTAHNKEVQILKREEVRKLFPENWKNVWTSHEVYIFNMLAACTGMRLSEIMGLQRENIHDNYIHVCVQYSKKYGLRPLKTKDSRNVPIVDSLRRNLLKLVNYGQGFVFSDSGGKTPISRSRLYRETGRAFDKIGIDSRERKKRSITLHHWRHFLNTALLMANVSTLKVQKVTGHKSLSMTRHYTHFDSREFSEVLDVQKTILP